MIECASNDNMSIDDVEGEDDDEQKNSKEDPDSRSSKENTSKEVQNISKMLTNQSYLLQTLKKGDYIIHKSTQSKLQIKKFSHKNDLSTASIIAEPQNEKDPTEIISLANIDQFTVFSNIRILLVNYLNRVFSLLFPTNINSSIELVKNDFCSIHNCDSETIGVIFKNKRLPSQNLAKFYISKDFDLKNDFLVFIQAKPSFSLVKFDLKRFNAEVVKENRKIIILTSSPVLISSIFLLKRLSLAKMEIEEINEDSSKYCTRNKKGQLINRKSLFNQILPQDSKKNLTVLFMKNNFEDEEQNQKRDVDDFYGGLKVTSNQYRISPGVKFTSDKIYCIQLEYKHIDGRSEKLGKENTFEDEIGNVKFSIIPDSLSETCPIKAFEFQPLSDFDN